VSVAAARHAVPSEVSPVVPRGGWEDAWRTSLVVAFVLYGLGAWLARSGRIPFRLVVIVAITVQALPLAAPLLLSKDVFAYWNQSRIVIVHRANPYRSTPADYPNDPALPFISESWRESPTVYGPAWVAAGSAPAAVAGASSHRAELAYRVFAVVALVASIAVVAVRTRSAAAVAFLGWSPLLALHYAGGGHGDAWMMLFVLLAVAAGTRAAGGALWAVSAAFKPLALVLMPLEIARRRLHMSARWWTGLIIAAIGIVALSTAFFGTSWARGALTGVHQASPLGGVHWLTELGLAHRTAVGTAAAAFLAVYAGLLTDAWRRGRARLSLAASALCLSSSLLRPWYALWPVALAAIEEDIAGAVVAYLLSGYLLFGDAVRF
jgi:alpha-1,6-mannosyltransferase